ncbi:MAG: Na/Pi cotransporter family protein [Clostridia bacterium]
MNQTLLIIFGLLGGLAIFIYGMMEMSAGLKRIAGDRMRKILKALTGNPFMGILVGALVTALMQSSSATTVMVIGFTAARLMTLPQAIAVIMGANIGTTFTSQLVAFKIGDYAYPITAIGFALMMFSKKRNIKNVGQTLFSFGLLFVGINLMSQVMKPLAQLPAFADALVKIQDIPILGLMVSALMTVLIQSSSAVIAVIQNLAATPGADGMPLIPLVFALPLLFGSNIGTTITAILAATGSGISAKRVALAHLFFNVLGAIAFMFFIPLFERLILFITPALAGVSRQIANAHTVFNVLNTLIWLPFIGILAKLVTWISPGEDLLIENRPLYLDDKMLSSPSIAMNLATQELARMASITYEMMETAEKAFINNDMISAKKVHEIEDTVDILQNEIVHYLSKLLSTATLTEHQSIRLTGLMHVVSDIERIGDYCDNIAESAEIKYEKGLPFSDEAIVEITDAFNIVTDMVKLSIDALSQYDAILAKRVLSDEYLIDDLEMRLRAAHIDRLNKGYCNIHSGITFVELIHNLERIGDHCNNIAEAVLDDLEKVPRAFNE